MAAHAVLAPGQDGKYDAQDSQHKCNPAAAACDKGQDSHDQGGDCHPILFFRLLLILIPAAGLVLIAGLVLGLIMIPAMVLIPALILVFIAVFILALRLATFHPKVSAILNITPDHLARHKTMENYIAAKERIFENQLSTDFMVLNIDDPIVADIVGS